MVDFMLEHEALGRGRVDGEDKEQSDNLWKTLTNILNSAGRPTRNTDAWRKVYSDWKVNTKKKASEIASHDSSTGKCPKVLTPSEIKLLGIIAKSNTSRSSVTFTTHDSNQSNDTSHSNETIRSSEPPPLTSTLNNDGNNIDVIMNDEILDEYKLQWNNYKKEFCTGFGSLLISQELVDVTIAVEGKFMKAHKLVLSVCSDYFRDLFKTTPCKHPIVVLKDVDYDCFSSLLQFMYYGEVQVTADKLPAILEIATLLQIKGLNGKPGQPMETLHDPGPPPESSPPPLTEMLLLPPTTKPTPKFVTRPATSSEIAKRKHRDSIFHSKGKKLRKTSDTPSTTTVSRPTTSTDFTNQQDTAADYLNLGSFPHSILDTMTNPQSSTSHLNDFQTTDLVNDDLTDTNLGNQFTTNQFQITNNATNSTLDILKNQVFFIDGRLYKSLQHSFPLSTNQPNLDN